MQGDFRGRCQHGDCNTQLTKNNSHTTSVPSLIRAAGLASHNTGTVCLCKMHYNVAASEVRFAEKQAAEVPEATETPVIEAATAAAALETDAPGQQRQQQQQQQQQQQPPPPPPSRPATRPRPAPNPPVKLQSVPRAASATSGKRYDRMLRHMRAPELVRMLQEKAVELKALQRSKQDLHAAMVRRRTKQRIQQRAQRGLILLFKYLAAAVNKRTLKLPSLMGNGVASMARNLGHVTSTRQNRWSELELRFYYSDS